MKRGRVRMSTVLSCHSPLNFLRQSFTEPDPPIFALSEHWSYKCVWPCPGFYIGTVDLNSGPHGCIASDYYIFNHPSRPSDTFLKIMCYPKVNKNLSEYVITPC